MSFADTIVALATASGPSGIAVIRASGSEAFGLVKHLTGKPVEPGRFSLRRVVWEGRLLDKAIVLAFAAPHSYTGEDVVEFQCHGGDVTSRRILEALIAAGARLAKRGEFTARALLNGRIDYAQAEGTLNLIEARTARAADAALRVLDGSQRKGERALYEEALAISAELEHALDLDEEELGESFVPRLAVRLASLRAKMELELRRVHEGHLLSSGALVVLAGPPNAGKSALMNALLESDRVLVSERPGTTRDSVEDWLSLEGWPIRLVDTAGLRETDDAIEAEGVRRAKDLIARADIVLVLGGAKIEAANTIILHAKCDLGRGEGLNVSAKTGEGLDELKRALVARLETLVPEASALRAEPLIAALAEMPREIADLVLTANAMRSVAEKLGDLVGAIYSEDLLDNLFSRFCVGK